MPPCVLCYWFWYKNSLSSDIIFVIIHRLHINPESHHQIVSHNNNINCIIVNTPKSRSLAREAWVNQSLNGFDQLNQNRNWISFVSIFKIHLYGTVYVILIKQKIKKIECRIFYIYKDAYIFCILKILIFIKQTLSWNLKTFKRTRVRFTFFVASLRGYRFYT